MVDEPEGFGMAEIDPRNQPPRQGQDRLPIEEPQPPQTPSQAPVPIVPGSGQPPEPKPYTAPRFAAVSIIPKRTATMTAPEPYEAFKVTLWINPPDGEVTARAESARNLGDYMSHFITDWSLTDEEGTKLPITEASMEVFPKDLWDWMVQEFGEARTRPLVPPKNDTTAKNQTPRQMNQSRNPSLNGTTP